MSTVLTDPATDTRLHQEVVANDFSLQVATANGSGSQTANSVLMRSIFQMGVPVSGKNLFPSNIQGLPTWFTIRANKDGYIARKRDLDIQILMNPETAVEDTKDARSGSFVIFESKLGVEKLRDDLIFYPVPFAELVVQITTAPEHAKLRKLIVNMIYVGVTADLMGIDQGEIDKAIRKQLGNKPKAIDLNLNAVRLGREYSEKTFAKKIPYRVERMDGTAGKIIIDGNTAAALGCLFGGATVLAWYPITPSSSLCESFIDFADSFRKDPATGKSMVACIQAEDEIASIGMVVGAGWAGARSFTSTSGPGISLMSEIIGLAYYTDIPAVIFDVQRTGPSTGLPTRTMQGDILLCYYNSQGDTLHPVLFPNSPEENFSMAMKAFDLAEELQTPIFVLTDLDLGMNNWMSDPFPYPAEAPRRGKVLDVAGIEKMNDWGRYKDVDGDGIPYRTLPGTPSVKGAYFTRGSGHNEMGVYSEKPVDYVNNMDRLKKKFNTARTMVPAPEIQDRNGSGAGILAFGSSHWGVVEARDRMAREFGIELDYLRLRALPIGPEAKSWIDAHDRIYVVEQNRDGQLATILRDEFPAHADSFISVRQYNGLPLDATTVIDGVLDDRQQPHGRPSGKEKS